VSELKCINGKIILKQTFLIIKGQDSSTDSQIIQIVKKKSKFSSKFFPLNKIIQTLFGSNLIWFKPYLVQTLFGSNLIWFKPFLVQTSFGSNLIWFKPFLVQTLFGSNLIWFKPYLVQTLFGYDYYFSFFKQNNTFLKKVF
jgi:hypothetical protein